MDIGPQRAVACAPGSPRLWTGDCKGETRGHRIFSFLTTDSNDIVHPVHAKAMPVLLTMPEKRDAWLGGTTEEAVVLQRPLPTPMLKIVATGEKTDEIK